MAESYNNIMEQKAAKRKPLNGEERLTHPDGTWLSELPQEVKAVTGIRVGDFIVNPHTGEILGEYSVNEVAPPTREEIQYLTYITKFPSEITHVEQLHDYLSVAVDGRRIVKFNDCEKIHDSICGEAKRKNKPTILSVPEYTKLNNLCNELMFMNFIVGDAETVASKIKVSRANNIRRDYSSLVTKGLVTIQSSLDGMMTGQIKISVHPFFGYVHERGVFSSSRNACLQEWIKQERTPIITTEFINSLPAPAPYSDGIKYDDSKYVSLYISHNKDTPTYQED